MLVEVHTYMYKRDHSAQYFIISAESGSEVGRQFHLDDLERSCRTLDIGGKGGNFLLAMPLIATQRGNTELKDLILKDLMTGTDLECITQFDCVVCSAVFNTEGDKIVAWNENKCIPCSVNMPALRRRFSSVIIYAWSHHCARTASADSHRGMIFFSLNQDLVMCVL